MRLFRVQTAVQEADKLQRAVARLVARSPAGVNLLLIGGFRLRLLDRSQRLSVDIDYHWSGNLEAKQQELLSLCRRVILRQVKRELGYEGSVSLRKGPEADSPVAKFLDLRFWKDHLAIEIPLELTQILCLDPPIVRTAEGTVHATPSDADLIESKIIAIFNRLYLQHRDLLDLFLHGEKLRPDSPDRVKQKFARLRISSNHIARKLADLRENSAYHAAAIQKVIVEQMDSTVARQMDAGGGGKTVLEAALSLLARNCPS